MLPVLSPISSQETASISSYSEYCQIKVDLKEERKISLGSLDFQRCGRMIFLYKGKEEDMYF